MTERRLETQPTTVPNEARRVGEIWGRWSWVELSVWTERMLTALENGMKGGKWSPDGQGLLLGQSSELFCMAFTGVIHS